MVGEEHTAPHVGSGRVRVLATPVMVNLLGDLWYLDNPHHAKEPDWAKLFAVPNLKLHLYGKAEPRDGRKMGHFTVRAATVVS